MATDEKPDVAAVTFSFVVPFQDEAERLPTFCRALHQVAEKLNEPYEIIFVNDGSTDESGKILRGLRSDDDHVKYVELTRSFGRQAALTAGLDCAAGMAAIALNSRCRCTPDVLGRLIEKWRQGHEVVYTVGAGARPLPWAKRWADKVFGWAFRKFSKPDVADEADFRLLDRRGGRALKAAREKTRFTRGLLGWMGFRKAAVPYEAEPAPGPESRYSVFKMAGAAAGTIFNFSVLPLRFIGAAGLVMLAGALLYGIIAVICWPFLGASVTANLILLAVGLLGVQLAVLGVLGEYIGTIHDEARYRPIYVVREAVGFEAAEEEPHPQVQRAAREVMSSEPSRIRFFT